MSNDRDDALAPSEAVTMRVQPPPGRLAPWVHMLWYSSGVLEHRVERVLPSTTCELVVNLGDPMELSQMGRRSRVVGCTISGLTTAPFELRHPVSHTAVGLRLSALGVRRLLGVPSAALRDHCVPLPDVLATCIDELSERCADARGADATLVVLAQWFEERLARSRLAADPIVEWAINRLECSGGRLEIEALQAASGFGATRFNARFADELGVTPKRYARLVRFGRALEGLSPHRPLSQLALDLGFSDQPHLNREFRQLAGRTPSEVLASRYPGGLTLAEAD